MTAKSKRPPAALFASPHSSVGRTLAASLVAVRLSEECNVLLADWGFGQSPLMRYFDVDHLFASHSRAQDGIFAAPRLTLFSASHFGEDSAAERFAALADKADVLVISCADSLPEGLPNEFDLGFVAFSYSEGSAEEAAKVVAEMSGRCREVRAMPVRVDLAFPAIGEQRARARAALEGPAGKRIEELELPQIDGRGALFDLPSMHVEDEAVMRFLDAAAGAVKRACLPTCSKAHPEDGFFPSLIDASLDESSYVSPPPISGLSEEESRPRLPSPIPFGSEDAPAGAGDAPDAPDGPAEEAAPAAPAAPEAEGQPAPADVGADAGATEPAAEIDPADPAADGDPEHEPARQDAPEPAHAQDAPAPAAEQAPPERAPAAPADAERPPDVPFAIDELRRWIGFDASGLAQRHAAALESAGFAAQIPDGDANIRFGALTRASRAWDDGARRRHEPAALIHCLALADSAAKDDARTERKIRLGAEEMFGRIGAPWADSEQIRVARMFNLIAVLALAAAGDSEQAHKEAEALLPKAIELTPPEATAGSERLLQMRRLALGIALHLRPLRGAEEAETRAFCQSESELLPAAHRRLLPRSAEPDEGAQGAPPLDAAPRLEFPDGFVPEPEEDADPGGPARKGLLDAPFPLEKLQEWAGYDIAGPLEAGAAELRSIGLAPPKEGANLVEAFALFNRKHHSLNKTRRGKLWSESILLCLAIADRARREGSPIEQNVRDRIEHLFSEVPAEPSRSEPVRVLRMLNLIGLLCAAMEAGAEGAHARKAEDTLNKAVDAIPEHEIIYSDKLLALRRVAMALGLLLPSMGKDEKASKRMRFEQERDQLPEELLALFPALGVGAKVRELSLKVAELA